MDDHKKFWDKINHYDETVFSVFADKKAENPIFDYLRKKPHNLTVADIGCGSGNFLPFLSKHFKQVIAVDYSENLLEKAKKEHPQLANVIYTNLDMRNLAPLRAKLDLAVSVNSLVTETVGDAEQILKEIYKSIKPGGEFVAVLPSAETYIWPALLVHQKMLDEGIEERSATKFIEKVFGVDRQFNALGFQRDNEKSPRQKYFFSFEIEWRLKRAGFKMAELKKVHYSWDYCKKHNFGYFPKCERIWDWFVVAKK